MTSKAERRRRRKARLPFSTVPAQPLRQVQNRPSWLDDKRELVRRLPAFAALELCGAMTREQREAGDLFAMKYRLAVEHMPALVGSYGARGGRDVDEQTQDAARRWVRSTLKLAGPAGAMLEALARDERLPLTEREVVRLRIALEQIAKSPA